MTHSINTASAWPEAEALPSSRASRKAILAALALGAATVTAVVIPSASFRAKAVISVADVGSPLSAILSRNAAEAAVSKPVATRAAESLIGTGFAAPEPDVAERVALATHLAGTKATGKVARLAADLPRHVSARPGEMPGTLDIVASNEDAERATQMATSVADALIANQEDAIVVAHRKRESDAATRLERLKADVAAARRQLAALGGDEADPAQALATAAAQTARAQLRADTIRAIITSGSPPLSDRRDVPSAIETLQSAYLDLVRQLAKQRETLGERHTTIIALQAELRHASASLSAEWRRLGRLADAEVGAAREREAKLRKADTGSGGARREAIEEARRKVQFADDAVARAFSTIREPAADERGYRLVMRPSLPNAADGLTLVPRLLLAGLAGFLTLGCSLLVSRRLPSRHVATRLAVVETASSDLSATESDDARPVPAVATAPAQDRRAHDDLASQFDERAPGPRVDPTVETADAPLMHALIDLLPQIETIEPAFGPVPTVMIAANEITADVTPVAIALGRAAAGRGFRVLVIEATRSRPELAAAADTDADPILVDFFGTLRVALRATASDGALFLAPNLQRGTNIASALARQGGTPLVDDIGAEFDLVVIDGGRCTDAAAAGWGADAYLRVGRHRSHRDDTQFASAFGVSGDAILGTVVASVFASPPAEPAPPPARPVVTVGRSAQRTAGPAVTAASPSMRHAPPRRRLAAR